MFPLAAAMVVAPPRSRFGRGARERALRGRRVLHFRSGVHSADVVTYVPRPSDLFGFRMARTTPEPCPIAASCGKRLSKYARTWREIPWQPGFTTLLGRDADGLLGHRSKPSPKSNYHLPAPIHRPLCSCPATVARACWATWPGCSTTAGWAGRAMCRSAVDQGIEHSAGGLVRREPIYFDAESIVRLAVGVAATGVASTFGVLASWPESTRTGSLHRQAQPQTTIDLSDSTTRSSLARVQQAGRHGGRGVGATIYFGSPESNRQIIEVSQAFAKAHELGLATSSGVTCATTPSDDKRLPRFPPTDRPGRPPGRGRSRPTSSSRNSREQRRLHALSSARPHPWSMRS